MSLTASLHAASAGLSHAARRAEIIATNVARADEPGYAQRRLGPVDTAVGAEVGRVVDPALQQARREAGAQAEGDRIAHALAAELDRMIGDPDQPGSLQAGLARFEAALITASADPTSMAGMAAATAALTDTVTAINALAETVGRARQQAEDGIATAVSRLNADLGEVGRLNAKILRLEVLGQDASDLRDRRASHVDSIAEAVPIRQLPRDDGTVALVTLGGAILLDGSAAEIGFEPRQAVAPDHGHPADLAGLTLRGKPAGTGEDGGLFAGGGLAARFALRDEAAPEAMARLDALALDLASRLQEADLSIGTTGTGPLTDDGARVQAAPLPGLALRLALDPRLEGDGARLLRDGMDSAAATHAPDQLLASASALREAATPRSAALGGMPSDMGGLAGRLRSMLSADRIATETARDASHAERDRLVALRDGGAVDIDGEMQRLLQVEQAYAANARLIQAVGQMMDRLTEI